LGAFYLPIRSHYHRHQRTRSSPPKSRRASSTSRSAAPSTQINRSERTRFTSLRENRQASSEATTTQFNRSARAQDPHERAIELVQEPRPRSSIAPRTHKIRKPTREPSSQFKSHVHTVQSLHQRTRAATAYKPYRYKRAGHRPD